MNHARPLRTLCALVALVAATAWAIAAPAGASGGKPRLQLRHTSVGTILVDHRGYTVYAFDKDRRNHDACAAISECLQAWPALTRGSGTLAGPGIRKSLIGVITIKGGVHQLTYAGHPLYLYYADSEPGETYNINIDQFTARWPALNAAGKLVR